MLGGCCWWHWALCVLWHTSPLPDVGQLWTSLPQDWGLLLSLQRKSAEARTHLQREVCTVLYRGFQEEQLLPGLLWTCQLCCQLAGDHWISGPPWTELLILAYSLAASECLKSLILVTKWLLLI